MQPQAFKRTMKLMGNQFELTVVAHTKEWADQMIDEGVKEIQRIEKLLTTFSDDSQTYKINQNAGVSPVMVEPEVFQLIERSLAISRITQGAFDISYGGLDKSLWNFDRSMTALPNAATAKKMVHLIDYRNILLDAENQTVFLRKKGMRIGFGGIGKGYAAQCARRLLKLAGAEGGIVNASGDLATWGNQPDGRPWTIGIADPEKLTSRSSWVSLDLQASSWRSGPWAG